MWLAVQIDLTDDYVVMAFFGDGSWEDQVRRGKLPIGGYQSGSYLPAVTDLSLKAHFSAAAVQLLFAGSFLPAAADATCMPFAYSQMQRLQARENEDGTGSLMDAVMDQESFRDLISVLED